MYIPCMKEHETHTPYLLSVSIVRYNVYYLFIYQCLINFLWFCLIKFLYIIQIITKIYVIDLEYL